MSDKYLQHLSNYSKECQLKIGVFINERFPPEQKKKENTKKCQKLESLFKSITSAFPLQKSREMSKNQRNSKQLSSLQYNYGEISFKTISLLLNKILNYRKMSTEQIFYDLGSGAGKVLFAASICYPFKKCIGIQLLKSLHEYSSKLKQKILMNISDIQDTICSQTQATFGLPQIQMINADFKEYDWSNGTVAFVSSTCYSQELMKQISRLSQKMQKGSIFVTLTKKLQERQTFWTVLESVKGETSWGETTVFIQVKKQ